MSNTEVVLVSLLVLSNVMWAAFFNSYRSKVRELRKDG